MLPIIGYIIITLFFFFDVGIVYYYYIFVGAVLLLYSSLYFSTTPTFAIVYLPPTISLIWVCEVSDRAPVVAVLVDVEIAELLELTDDTDEFKSIILLYKFVLFLNSCAKFILNIVSVGNVGLDSSNPP